MASSMRIVKRCAHCGGPMRGSAGLQWMGVAGSTPLRFDLCHPPDVGMDCYRLVTVYGHQIVDCPCVSDDS